MDLLAKIAIISASLAFMSGLLLTAVTGSARLVKIFLGILALVFCAGIVAGFVLSKGLFVYLLFQIIALAVALVFAVILGAVCGGGIYLLVHKKPPGTKLTKLIIGEYLPIAEFSTLEGITEERAVLRIKGGFYRGGTYEGNWYVHKAELS